MSRFRSRRSRLGGFTLVELLVVIGIIALLIGILLPTLSRAREASKSIVCLSNVRQTGQAVPMFVNEHDGYVFKPWFNDEPNNNGDRYKWEWRDPYWGWDTVVMKYLDQASDVLACPSDPAGPDVNPYDPGDTIWNIRSEWSASTEDDYPSSYRYNASNGARGPFFAMKLSRIEFPTEAILIFDGLASNFHHAATWEENQLGQINPNNEFDVVDLMRHNEGKKSNKSKANYLFFDGHGESLAYESTWKPVGESLLFEGEQPGPWNIVVKTVYPTPWRTTYVARSGSVASGGYIGWHDIVPYDPATPIVVDPN